LKKNILHISTHDSGGAALAAFRLHQRLKENDFNSKFAVKYKTVVDNDVIEIQPSLLLRIHRKITNLFKSKKQINTVKDYYFFNLSEEDDYFPTKQLLAQLPVKPDVIIIYWISDFINSRNLAELKKLTDATILWYFLDMGPLTGGCHYFWDCKNFLTHCGNCPALNSHKEHDISFNNFSLKNKFISDLDISLLLGTKQLITLARQSPLFKGKRYLHLPIGIDMKLFRPTRDRAALREKYGIPKDATVILMVSGAILEKRKGIFLAVECMKLLNSEDNVLAKSFFVLMAGGTNEKLVESIPFENYSMGFLNEEELPLAYQLADVFLCSSIEDAGPMMVMESLACGVPVVGFNIGIIPDIVKHGETGYVAEKGNVIDLAAGINKIRSRSEKEMETMSQNCRNTALTIFNSDSQVSNLIAFIHELDKR
jgi:glycosyltransferase involved in cell wall biosynthesis